MSQRAHSINRCLLASYASMIVLLGVAWVVALVASNTLRASYNQTVNTVDALSGEVTLQIKLMDDEETGLRGYLLTESAAFLQPWTAARKALPVARERASALASTAPRVRPLLMAMDRYALDWEHWAAPLAQLATTTPAMTVPRGSTTLLAQQLDGKTRFDRYRTAAGRVARALDDLRQRELNASLQTLTRLTWLFAVLFAVTVGMAILIGWRMTRAVARPLAALGQAARSIGHGDLTRPIRITGAREFTQLGESMDWMRDRLAGQAALVAAREADLAASEERLRTVMANAPIILFALDAAGVFTLSEGTGLEALGLAPGAMVGLSAFDVYAEVPEIMENIRRALAGEAVSYVGQVSGITFATQLAPLRDERGGVSGVIGVATDVTDRERAEEALRASEERFRENFDRAALGMAVVGLDGRYRQVNTALCRLLGYDAEELLALRAQDLTLTDDMPTTEEGFTRLRAGTIDTYQAEKRYQHKDGHAVWVEINTTLVRDNQGGPLHLISQAQDIIARKQAEGALAVSRSELERSNAELQQFAYVASHDLQEPLRTIASYLQLLKRRYAGRVLDEGADEYIAFAVDGAKRMQTLIQAVLAYSRVGTHGKDFAPTDTHALVAGALANLEARLAETGARVTVAGDLPTVWGDDTQLGQLFQNLIGNALKFTRPGETSAVAITAERREEEWAFAVRDNGIGLPPEQAERIFGMFQRLHARDEYEGAGIGLAVCKRIVERHGGRIWVESRPGEGATFLFTLPVHYEEREDTAA